MSLTHTKVSAVPDGVNPGFVQPSDWNADHIFNPALTGILADPLGSNAFVGINATQENHFLRSRINSVTRAYEFTAPYYIKSTDYDFSQTVAQNLTGGVAATVSLSPVPAGIVASHSPNYHYIRIIDAVGGDETVLITAVTATTISFLPTLSHASGNWSIISATAGLQEAYNKMASSLTSPDILIPDKLGGHIIYQRFLVTGAMGRSIRIRGLGHISSRLTRHSSFPAGDLIRYDGALSAGHVIFQDFGILNANGFNQTSGSAINLIVSQLNEVTLHRVYVLNGVAPIVVNPVNPASSYGSVIMDQVNVNIQAGYSGTLASPLYTTGDGITLNVPESYLINCRSTRDVKFPLGGSGLRIARADGIRIQGGHYNGANGIVMQANPLYHFNFVYIEHVTIDETYSHGIYLLPGAHNLVFSQLRIAHCQLATQNGDVNASGINIANDIQALQIIGNNISGFFAAGISLGLTDSVPRGAVVAFNTINNCGQSGTGYGIAIPPTGSGGSGSYDSHTVITGNVISNDILAYGAATQQYAIFFAGSAGKFIGYTITGNDCRGNTINTIVKSAGTTLENCVIKENGGISDLFAAIASNVLSGADATLFYENIATSGTTNVTSFTPVWEGREIVVTKFDAGTVNFTAAGNIAVASTLTANQIARFKYNVSVGKWLRF